MTDDRFENPYFDSNSHASQNFSANTNDKIEAQFINGSVTDDTLLEGREHRTEEYSEFAQPQQEFFSDSSYTEAHTQPPVSAAPQPIPVAENVFQQPAPQPSPQPPYSCEWYGGNSSPSQPYAAPYTPQNNNENKPKRERRGVSKGAFIVGIALCLCFSFVTGFAGTWFYNYINSLGSESKNGLTVNKVDGTNVSTAYSDSGMSTVDIVNKTADSVVEITTETVTTGIFAQQYIESGAGSGVIVDVQGYIVTNHHVIDGATKISVTLRDGTSYDAKLLGSDAEMDIALLEIEPDINLTAATFGDSDTLQVGQRTVAIGNPLGQLGGSVTEGIISALNRDVVIDGQTMSLLQTDTAINPGNSGGGLFDSYGNLIGIVNAKSSGSEVEGLGFAIPINDVVDIIGDLAEYGYVRGRVDPGMTFIDVDSEQLAWMYGLKKTGCYIYSVDKNTNADIAGFESGDRVISVNGTEVTTSEEVERILNDCAVGEEVTFYVENTAGKNYTIGFELQEYVPESNNDNFFENGNSNNDYSYWWSEYH